MKTRFLIVGLALATTVSFGQKKELRKAEKAIKSSQFNEAIKYLDEAESQLGSVDNSMKAQFYATRGEAILGTAKTDHKKLLAAAEAYQTAISLDPKIQRNLEVQLHNLRSALIDGAMRDQNAKNYKQAGEKLYASYLTTKDESDLYFAAGNAVNGQDYDTALEYYQMLLDSGYTGVEEQFVATDKASGEVRSFGDKNLRDLAIKSGGYIKPDIQKTESRKGEILRNMTLIYIEQGNNEKANALMKSARAESPNDIDLMRADAYMSYKMGDLDRYQEILNQIVASDPDNPEIYFNLGVGAGETGDKDKAIGYYEKALELNPNYEAALINLSVLKLSAEDALVEEMNSLGNSAADNKRYDELRKLRREIQSETLPYLQTAYKINPKNPEVVRTLMNIYGQLGNDAKFAEMKAKFEELNADE